jgi:hypothetical protein
MSYTEEVNKTYRANGAVGKEAVVPKKIAEIFNPNDGLRILDYGAGTLALHAKNLRKLGFYVDAYDIGENTDSCNVQGLRFPPEYDVVYASNVINVQPTLRDVQTIINHIKVYALKPGGKFLFNYPSTPRKYGRMTNRILYNLLLEYFYKTEKLEKNMFLCTKGNK